MALTSLKIMNYQSFPQKTEEKCENSSIIPVLQEIFNNLKRFIKYEENLDKLCSILEQNPSKNKFEIIFNFSPFLKILKSRNT